MIEFGAPIQLAWGENHQRRLNQKPERKNKLISSHTVQSSLEIPFAARANHLIDHLAAFEEQKSGN
jgi:hypothetical protein